MIIPPTCTCMGLDLSKTLITIICTALQRQNYEQTEKKENCFYFLSVIFLSTNSLRKYREFSHDVTVAILVFQTNPTGVGFFSYVNNSFFFPQICIDAGHVSENALHRDSLKNLHVDIMACCCSCLYRIPNRTQLTLSPVGPGSPGGPGRPLSP